jgi:hypothetical protein
MDRLFTLLSQFGVRVNLFYDGKLCCVTGKSDGCWRVSLFTDTKNGRRHGARFRLFRCLSPQAPADHVHQVTAVA